MLEYRVCANGKDLPDYLDEMQSIAMKIEAILELMNLAGNEGKAAGGTLALIEILVPMANALTTGLDCTNLPEVAA